MRRVHFVREGGGGGALRMDGRASLCLQHFFDRACTLSGHAIGSVIRRRFTTQSVTRACPT